MKQIILLLLTLFFAMGANAQISTTLSEGSYYYVVVAGDTISQHNRLDKAIESASEATMMGGDWEIVQNYRLRGSSWFYEEDIIIEETIDTVFVPIEADTIIIENTEMLTMITDGIEGDPDSDVYMHHIRGTAYADFLGFEWFCGEESVGEYSDTFWEGSFYVEIPLDCQSDLKYVVTARSQLQPTRIKTATHEEIVGIDTILGIEDPDMGVRHYTDFTDFNEAEWINTWGELSFVHLQEDSATAELEVTLPTRNIARLQWNEVPLHNNGHFMVVEEIDSTHSTGFHIGLKTSMTEPKSSVETYLHGDGLGVSIFKDGTWSNPVSYPADWNYGETWISEASLVGDTLRVRAYQEGTLLDDLPEFNTYVDSTLSEMPAGYFSVGSTGAGIYKLKQVIVITENQ